MHTLLTLLLLESLFDASVVLVMHHIDSDSVIVPLHDLPVSPLTKTHFTATFQCVLLSFFFGILLIVIVTINE